VPHWPRQRSWSRPRIDQIKELVYWLSRGEEV
jgi:hypothetical protein